MLGFLFYIKLSIYEIYINLVDNNIISVDNF